VLIHSLTSPLLDCDGSAARGRSLFHVADHRCGGDSFPPHPSTLHSSTQELGQCGITAHDYAARNVFAFNVEFSTLCGDSEMRLEADDANEDDE